MLNWPGVETCGQKYLIQLGDLSPDKINYINNFPWFGYAFNMYDTNIRISLVFL